MERHCISNVRTQGLTYEAAARKSFYLMSRAPQLKLSGIGLKDGSDVPGIESGVIPGASKS